MFAQCLNRANLNLLNHDSNNFCLSCTFTIIVGIVTSSFYWTYVFNVLFIRLRDEYLSNYILIHEMEFLSKFHIMYCCSIQFLSSLILFFNPPNKLTYSFKFLFINTKIKRLSHKSGRCNDGNPDLLNDFTPGVQKGRNIWFIHSFLTIHHPFSYHVVFHMWGVTIKVLPSS